MHVRRGSNRAELMGELMFRECDFYTAPLPSNGDLFANEMHSRPLPMFPGSRLTYLALLEEPRFEDYHITYKNSKNMFEFLGNGFHAREFDGRDLSYYLGILDDIGDQQLDLEVDLAADMGKLMPQIEEAIDQQVEPVAGLS